MVYYELLKPNETITEERYRLQIMCLSWTLGKKKKRKGQYMNRETIKWFWTMTALGHMLQNRWKPTWKRLKGKSYPTCCIHHTLPLPSDTFWLSLVPIDGTWSYWAAFTFLWRWQKWANYWISSKEVSFFQKWNLNASRKIGKSRVYCWTIHPMTSFLLMIFKKALFFTKKQQELIQDPNII